MTRPLIRSFLALLLLSGLSSAQTTLRYSDHEPLGNMRTRFFKDVFFATIEQESKGRLKIEDHWNSSVSTGYNALRLVGEGKVTDIAVVVPEYTAKQLPLQQLFKSFPAGPSGDRQVAFSPRVHGNSGSFRGTREEQCCSDLPGHRVPCSFPEYATLARPEELPRAELAYRQFLA